MPTPYRPWVVATTLVAGLTITTAAQQNRTPQNGAAPGPAPIEVTAVRDNLYVLSGAGANIAASVGPDGVFLVDSGLEAKVEPMLAALAQLQKMVDFKRAPAERVAAEGNFSSLLEPYYRVGPPKP